MVSELAMVSFLRAIRVPLRGGYASVGRLNTYMLVDWAPGSVARTIEYSTRHGGNLHTRRTSVSMERR
jgi:hypothetical protein